MYYTDSHEWIELENGTATVGITQYAQNELGEIVYISFPEVGKVLKAKDEVCVLESTKAAADIYTPISGKITKVNVAVKENPALINKSAEKEAWLFQMTPENPEEIKTLLSKEEYSLLIGK